MEVNNETSFLVFLFLAQFRNLALDTLDRLVYDNIQLFIQFCTASRMDSKYVHCFTYFWNPEGLTTYSN